MSYGTIGGGGINLFRTDSGTHLSYQPLHYIHLELNSINSQEVWVAVVSK